jgi:V/A-type H+-transporting ATPase subunit E
MVETDAAAFARQLRQDGIEAARAEAADIINEARAQAAEIVQHAREAAGKTREEALSEIERDRQRFSAEIRLLARDTMLSVKRDIERLAVRLLKPRIGAALATEDVVRAAVLALISEPPPGKEWEIGVGPRVGKELVEAVVGDLFKGGEAPVALREELHRTGLEFRAVSWGEVFELSEESVADAFRQVMSPELSRLLESLKD